MIPWLIKRVKELEANQAFKTRLLKVGSWQRGRGRGVNLSRVVEEIIQDATRTYQMLQFAKASRDRTLFRSFARYNGHDLSGIPPFGPSSAVEWFEKVVWPELCRRKPELAANPQISDLKKANKSGKFQLSELRQQARLSVVRISRRPALHYFG